MNNQPSLLGASRRTGSRHVVGSRFLFTVIKYVIFDNLMYLTWLLKQDSEVGSLWVKGTVSLGMSAKQVHKHIL
jgi:hypothetical protein